MPLFNKILPTILKHYTLPSLFVMCLAEKNDLNFSKTIAVCFNVTFSYKLTTGLFLQKSTAYKRNLLLCNNVVNVLEKKYSVLSFLWPQRE